MSGVHAVYRWPLLCTCLLLGGCGSTDMDDLRAFVNSEKNRPQGAIEPPPEIKTYATFVYQAQNLREPFTPTRLTEPPSAAGRGNGRAGPDPDRRKEILEAYPLDTLRMVGTLERGERVAALIKAQDGTIYRVESGNYLGENHGRITQVADEKVELTEIIADGSGGWLERQASVALTE